MPLVPPRAKPRKRAPQHEFCKTNPPAKTAVLSPSCLRAFVVPHPSLAQHRATLRHIAPQNPPPAQNEPTRVPHPKPL
jgi:hypothetical protein